MKVVWSETAKNSFDDLVSFLERKWDAKVIRKLFSELNDALDLIRSNPYVFPLISDKKQIRKCVIRKKTLLLYTIDEKSYTIIILLIIDGRMNPLNFAME